MANDWIFSDTEIDRASARREFARTIDRESERRRLRLREIVGVQNLAGDQSGAEFPKEQNSRRISGNDFVVTQQGRIRGKQRSLRKHARRLQFIRVAIIETVHDLFNLFVGRFWRRMLAAFSRKVNIDTSVSNEN